MKPEHAAIETLLNQPVPLAIIHPSGATPDELARRMAEIPLFDHSPPKTVTIQPSPTATAYKIYYNVGNQAVNVPMNTPATDPTVHRALNPIVPDFFIFPTHYKIHQYNHETHMPETLGPFPMSKSQKEIQPIVDRLISRTLSHFYPEYQGAIIPPRNKHN